MKIALTANAGVAVDFEDCRVLVDALHVKKTRFSGVSDETIREVLDGGRNTAAVLVTHAHADHYEEALIRQFLRQWPDAVLIGPVRIADIPQERQCFVEGEEGTAQAGSVFVRWLKILHEGPEYADVPNYGYRVQCGGESFVVLGDAALREAEQALRHLAGPDGTDAALTNFPMLALGAGRRALSGIPIRHVLGFHLPFEEDDTEGYRKSAVRSLRKAEEACGCPVTLLLKNGQIVTTPPQD